MSNSILPAAGNLDIVNANVRADKFNAATNIGVANTNPDFNFSVGDKFHVDKDSTDPVSITGNVVASGIKISNLTIGPAFDFASVSNVGNVTANVIQFANATTGFTTTANVEIGGNISLTANAQVKVGSNVLTEYTGPHGRDPKEVPLKKYPEIAFAASKLDGNDTTNTYTQAGYTVTASSDQSQYNLHAWRIFDENTTSPGNGWASQDGTYYDGTSPTNSYTGTTHQLGTGTAYGEWLKLELPHKIKVSRFTLYADPGSGYGTDEAPKSYKIYGSVLGSSWTELKNVSGEVPSVNGNSHEITDTTAYKYLAIVVTQVNTDQDNIRIGELKFYGYEEPAPVGDLSLDTTLKSTFNSVRSNNYVMYFDGEDPTGDPVVPKYLPSGTVKTITPNNIAFDATNNCWTLDGSTESNVTTADLGFEGDAPHTVSTWINASNLEANATTQQLFSIGSGYDKSFLKVDDTQIAANTWHNVTYAYQGEGGSKVTYVDGRKVEEAQVEDTFGDYPPFAMTGYSQGGYVVSASNQSGTNYESWRVFDDTNYGWETASGRYNTSSPYTHTAGVTTVTNVSSRVGDYIQLDLPYKIQVDYFDFTAQNFSFHRSPHTGVLAGSNDGGVTWTEVKFFDVTVDGSPTSYSASGVTTFSGFNPGFYKSFRLIWLTLGTGSNNNRAACEELKLYGHKEGDLTRFPEPTRVLEYPHIAVGVPQDTPAKRGYVVTTGTSIFSGRTGARAFDDQPTGDGWETDNGAFSDQVNQTGGDTFTNLGSGGGSFTGHWIQLEMPHKLKFTGHIEINAYVNGTTDDRRPDAGAFLGSNDGSNWYLLHEFTSGSLNWVSLGGTTNQAKITTLSASNTNAYKYVVMVITKKSDVGTSSVTKTSIRRLRYYGTQEDTGTPAIVGGPFAGKVANFRVYDQYLGDERIQEIYDAQKDAFGHKKSSMTLYKGRVGVGTTEPEGALTVLDEPHALAKFPARAVSANDSYVEGDGQIKLSAADGSGYQAFDGLTSTSWTATPTRNTRLSEEVDFGAWLKLQTPESVSLKKAEIESNPYWRQMGTTVLGASANMELGESIALSDDGTRLIVGAWNQAGTNNSGAVYVYDWNGSAWTQVGSVIGHHTVSGSRNGWAVSISGDGNTVAVGSRVDSPGTDSGSVTSFTLVGATWTLKGAVIATGLTGDFTGYALSRMSTDGNIVAFSDYLYDKQSSETDLGGVSGNSHNNAGRVRVFKYENGSWSQRGSSLIGENASDSLGYSVQMSEDGKYLIFSSQAGSKVYIFEWNGTTYVQRGSTLTGVAGDQFGESVDISKDGSIVAVGYRAADAAEGAAADDNGLVQMYKWDSTNNSYTLTQKLRHISVDASDRFGSSVSLSSDGKRLIVGADLDDTGGTDSGIAYVFESYDGSSWFVRHPYTSMSHTSSAGAAMVGHRSSLYVSRDGSTIGVGEPKNNTNGSDAGAWNAFSMPSNIKSIWGSNDDVNWTKITTGNETFRVDDRLEFKNLDNPNYYKYHAIVGDAFTRLKDIKLYGIRNQGSSTLHDGTLTLTKKVTAPQLESTGIINMKGDYTEIRANSNVVTEFNRSKKLIKYPRVALTQNASNNGYTVFQSGTNASEHRKAWSLFNNDVTTDDQYHAVPVSGETNPYNHVTGAYEPDVGFEDGLGDVAGEYVYVVMPDKIKLQGVSVHPRDGVLNRSAESARFMGSNNGTTWVDLGGYTNYVWASGSQEPGNFFTVDSNEYYNYIGVVWTKVKGGSGGDTVNMAEVQFFGVPEYDPEAHGTDVVVKSVPNVPNTDWLEVYYDGRETSSYSGSGTTVTDISPNTNNGTLNGGVGFDSTYKAFTFNGTTTRNITTTLPSSVTGEYVHSVSLWVKADEVSRTSSGMFTFFTIGSASSANMIALGVNTTGDGIKYDFYDASVKVESPQITSNEWMHFVVTYSGGANNLAGAKRIYLNGKELSVSYGGGSSSSPLSLPTSPTLTLGGQLNSSNPPFSGSIANFRLFNRVLTQDEIWQLYAYQKEYFGHGDLGMTLKAGRLGIGTSEPRAALDVRGIIRGTGVLTSGLPWFYARNQTAVTSAVTSYNVTSTDIQASNDALGTMYSTSYACLFPIKGIYIFSAQVHSVFHSAHNAGFDGVVRYSNGSQYYNVYSPTKIGATDGNFDTHSSCIFIITTIQDGMYLDLNHYTSASVQRNYSGLWNRNWGVCIYAL